MHPLKTFQHLFEMKTNFVPIYFEGGKLSRPFVFRIIYRVEIFHSPGERKRTYFPIIKLLFSLAAAGSCKKLLAVI